MVTTPTSPKNRNRYDLRISTIPAQHGEKMVLRLLDQVPFTHNLEALGFFQEDLRILKQACRSASGMVIMVGPTGNGKTTTLYAMLNLINSPSRNIHTIENQSNTNSLRSPRFSLMPNSILALPTTYELD